MLGLQLYEIVERSQVFWTRRHANRKGRVRLVCAANTILVGFEELYFIEVDLIATPLRVQ